MIAHILLTSCITRNVVSWVCISFASILRSVSLSAHGDEATCNLQGKKLVAAASDHGNTVCGMQVSAKIAAKNLASEQSSIKV